MVVDGSPLKVHGQVYVTVVVQGNTLETQALVVSPLTTEGILCLDFLKKHQATIDVRNRQLRLGSCDCTLSLVEAMTRPKTQPSVCAIATTNIPPNSKVEVMAHLSQPVQGRTWLLEEAPGKHLQPVLPGHCLVLSVTRLWCGCSTQDQGLLRFTEGVTLLLLNQLRDPSQWPQPVEGQAPQLGLVKGCQSRRRSRRNGGEGREGLK